MADTHYISQDHLNIEQIREIIESNKKLGLSESSISLVKKCREYLDQKIIKSNHQKNLPSTISRRFDIIYSSINNYLASMMRHMIVHEH